MQFNQLTEHFTAGDTLDEDGFVEYAWQKILPVEFKKQILTAAGDHAQASISPEALDSEFIRFKALIIDHLNRVVTGGQASERQKLFKAIANSTEFAFYHSYGHGRSHSGLLATTAQSVTQ